MKVKLLQSMAGNRFIRDAGKVYDLPTDEALRLIEHDVAVAVGDTPQPETAMIGGFETATRKPGRPRKVG